MNAKTKPDNKRANAAPTLVAVIELGTTSIRMVIAQMQPPAEPEILESLQHAVSLGKDSFTTGSIGPETTEACVSAMRSFRKTIGEYGVPESGIAAIATSAVREAANSEAFLDRLYIATGIEVRAVHEAEVNRYTYVAVHSMLAREAVFRDSDALVVEVGGGSTDLLEFKYGQVAGSHGYSLGSLRLRRTLEEHQFPIRRSLQIVRNQIDRTVGQIAQATNHERPPAIMALGGDIRFACTQLVPDWNDRKLARLDVSTLAGLANDIIGTSVDDVVRQYHVSYPEAETLGPALLVYVRLARALKLRRLYVGRATLREGVLLELAAHGSWTEDFRQQVVNSALETGAKYGFDRTHAEQVALICRQLFDALKEDHQLEPRYELFLVTAALLHEIGGFVSNRAHHKHTLYLILNSDIFGLGPHDLLLTALVARYHRRAMPKPSHEYYMTLTREDRVAVTKMAAILRVADCLCRSSGPPRKLKIERLAGIILITVEGTRDLALQQYALQQKGDLFERTFGLKTVLQAARRKAHGKT